MRLLVETQSPMADVATAAAFSTPNYFNKIFKQYMGVSPLAYKKKIK
jgi:AraC-like DNA-binding protein